MLKRSRFLWILPLYVMVLAWVLVDLSGGSARDTRRPLGSGGRGVAEGPVLRGRGFVTPEDEKTMGPDVLRHRLVLSFEAEAESITPDEVIQRIFDAVEVP